MMKNIEKLKERAAEHDVVLNDETIEALKAAERGEGTIISGVGKIFFDKDGGILISDWYYCPVGPHGQLGIPPENQKESDIK